MTVEKPIPNQNSSQSPVTCAKRGGKNRAYKVRLILVLPLIGWREVFNPSFEFLKTSIFCLPNPEDSIREA